MTMKVNFPAVTTIDDGSFFMLKLFPFHIVGAASGGRHQILDISLNRKVDLKTLKLKEQRFIVYFKEKKLFILSSKGEILESYQLVGENRNIISSYIDDLKNDGYDNIFLVAGEKGAEFGDTLIILSFDGGTIKEVHNQSFQVLNPWKVQTCNVDGDDEKEISLGVYKETQLHPVMAKRPFIYEWQEGMLVPKWRGSRLSRPFTDYIFSDMDGSGSDELIAIEILENGEKVLHAYKWKGFGFEGIGESSNYADIKEIKKSEADNNGKLYALVKERDEEKWYSFCLKEEKIEILKENGEGK
ncbi:hypothetical protein [Geosporobacter ferrireducens]|nr:hypothetical protein [Geosporobacter ferrireducens]